MLTPMLKPQLIHKDYLNKKPKGTSKPLIPGAFSHEKNEIATSAVKRNKTTSKVIVLKKEESLSRQMLIENLSDSPLSLQEYDKDLIALLQNIKEIKNRLQKEYNQNSVGYHIKNLSRRIDEINLIVQQNINPDLNSDFLIKLQKSIEPMLFNANLDVKKICQLVGISKTNLFVRLKALTGLSITHYVRKLRLSKAREMIMNNDLTIAEIAYNTGFNDPKYFAKVYHMEYGENPSESRKI